MPVMLPGHDRDFGGHVDVDVVVDVERMTMRMMREL
eukprot:COSAG06_NODE_60856_length_269_cov_1.058824_2_plen_35_part_01